MFVAWCGIAPHAARYNLPCRATCQALLSLCACGLGGWQCRYTRVTDLHGATAQLACLHYAVGVLLGLSGRCGLWPVPRRGVVSVSCPARRQVKELSFIWEQRYKRFLIYANFFAIFLHNIYKILITNYLQIPNILF